MKNNTLAILLMPFLFAPPFLNGKATLKSCNSLNSKSIRYNNNNYITKEQTVYIDSSNITAPGEVLSAENISATYDETAITYTHNSYNNTDTVHEKTDHYVPESIEFEGNEIFIKWKFKETTSRSYGANCNGDHTTKHTRRYGGKIKYTYGENNEYLLNNDNFENGIEDYRHITERNIFDDEYIFSKKDTYNSLEKIIRNSIVSSDEIQFITDGEFVLSEENTKIIFYSDSEGTEIIDKNSHISSQDIYIKILDNDPNDNIKGETRILSYKIPYIENYFIDYKNKNSYNMNNSSTVVKFKEDNEGKFKYDILTNSDVHYYVSDERISKIEIDGLESNSFIFDGKEYWDILIESSQNRDDIYNLEINDSVQFKANINNLDQEIKPMRVTGAISGKTPKHVVSVQNESNSIGNHTLQDYYFFNEEISIDLDGFYYSQHGYTYKNFVDSVFFDNILITDYNTPIIISDTLEHKLLIRDVFGNTKTFNFIPFENSSENLIDYFMTDKGKLHVIDAQDRNLPFTESIENILNHYSAVEIETDRDNHI